MFFQDPAALLEKRGEGFRQGLAQNVATLREEVCAVSAQRAIFPEPVLRGSFVNMSETQGLQTLRIHMSRRMGAGKILANTLAF